MLRRLFTLLLAVACACAPALAVSVPVNHEAADCCCANQCPCAPTESTAPGPSGSCAPAASPAAVEERTQARKPAPRAARSQQNHLLSEARMAPSFRAPAAFADSPVAGVALFRAHCALLI
ncbi:MAG: hypothetical protein JNK23_16360 [Opitutaceae bacterium]|nr:hypothetical protein [Opitutaceae bacterium]